MPLLAEPTPSTNLRTLGAGLPSQSWLLLTPPLPLVGLVQVLSAEKPLLPFHILLFPWSHPAFSSMFKSLLAQHRFHAEKQQRAGRGLWQTVRGSLKPHPAGNSIPEIVAITLHF